MLILLEQDTDCQVPGYYNNKYTDLLIYKVNSFPSFQCVILVQCTTCSTTWERLFSEEKQEWMLE